MKLIRNEFTKIGIKKQIISFIILIKVSEDLFKIFLSSSLETLFTALKDAL